MSDYGAHRRRHPPPRSRRQAAPTEAMTARGGDPQRSAAHYTWVGIYQLDGDELVLGPFLGAPSPHTRIPLGRGICGAAATARETIVVDDVNSDPRYLACSIETQFRDRGADHARRQGPRRDRHRQRPRLPPSAAPIDGCSKRRRPFWRRNCEAHDYAHSRRRHRPGSHRRGGQDSRQRRTATSSGSRTSPACWRSSVTARRCPTSCSTRSGATRWR